MNYISLIHCELWDTFLVFFSYSCFLSSANKELLCSTCIPIALPTYSAFTQIFYYANRSVSLFLITLTFGPYIDRRAKRQREWETGGQANPHMPSAPFFFASFLLLFHSILRALAPGDKPPHSLVRSPPLSRFCSASPALCSPIQVTDIPPLTGAPAQVTLPYPAPRPCTHTHACSHIHSSAAAMVMREEDEWGRKLERVKEEGCRGEQKKKEKGGSFSCNSITSGPRFFFSNGKSLYPKYTSFSFPSCWFPTLLPTPPPLILPLHLFSWPSLSHWNPFYTLPWKWMLTGV